MLIVTETLVECDNMFHNVDTSRRLALILAEKGCFLFLLSRHPHNVRICNSTVVVSLDECPVNLLKD
jgi:hypothetical protein